MDETKENWVNEKKAVEDENEDDAADLHLNLVQSGLLLLLGVLHPVVLLPWDLPPHPGARPRYSPLKPLSLFKIANLCKYMVSNLFMGSYAVVGIN